MAPLQAAATARRQLLAAAGAMPLQARALDCQAQAQTQLGMGREAVQSADQLLALLGRKPPLPDQEVQQARLDAAVVLAQAGHSMQARALMGDIYVRARERGDARLQVAALTAIGGDVGLRLRDDPTAALYLQQAIRLARHTGQSARDALYLALLVEIDRTHSDAARALLAELRQEMAGWPEHSALQWRLNTAEARIDLSVTQPLVALPLLRTTAEAQRRLHDAVGLQASLLAMGLAESYQNRPAQARLHSLEALKLAETAQSDTIPALHQLLDISFKAQDKDDISRYGQRLMQLGSKAQRKRWKLTVQTLMDRIGPPQPVPVTTAAALGAPATTGTAGPPAAHTLWLAWGSLLLGIGALSLAWQQRRHFRRRLQLSGIDPLCQVLTRREATARIDQQLASPAEASAPPMLLMLVDVDHFKHINDRHGHLVGDAVLTEIAARLKRNCRDQDIIGRWGGEEFLLACRTTDLQGAASLAERIRASIGDTPVSVAAEQAIRVTLSIGAALWPFVPDDPPAGDWQQALKPADTALYAVKRSGRDGWAVLRATQRARQQPRPMLLDDPSSAHARGLLSIISSLPLQWPASLNPAA